MVENALVTYYENECRKLLKKYGFSEDRLDRLKKLMENIISLEDELLEICEDKCGLYSEECRECLVYKVLGIVGQRW